MHKTNGWEWYTRTQLDRECETEDKCGVCCIRSRYFNAAHNYTLSTLELDNQHRLHGTSITLWGEANHWMSPMLSSMYKMQIYSSSDERLLVGYRKTLTFGIAHGLRATQPTPHRRCVARVATVANLIQTSSAKVSKLRWKTVWKCNIHRLTVDVVAYGSLWKSKSDRNATSPTSRQRNVNVTHCRRSE